MLEEKACFKRLEKNENFHVKPHSPVISLENEIFFLRLVPGHSICVYLSEQRKQCGFQALQNYNTTSSPHSALSHEKKIIFEVPLNDMVLVTHRFNPE